MLPMFLSFLENQLGLIVDPPLAPVVRMNIITEEIDMQNRACEQANAPDPATQNALILDIVEDVRQYVPSTEREIEKFERALRERLGG